MFHSDRCGKFDSAKMSRALLRLLPRLASSSAVAGPDLLAAQSVLGRGRGAAAGRCFASDADLLKTPLYDLHVEHGGGMLLPSAFLPARAIHYTYMSEIATIANAAKVAFLTAIMLAAARHAAVGDQFIRPVMRSAP